MKYIKDKDIKLTILDKKNIKINFKKVFFLYSRKKVIRGNHAHKKCLQTFFSLKGTFSIDCESRKGKKQRFKIIPGKTLKSIKPFTWVKVNLKKDQICGVLCDRVFEEDDYIRDYNQFKKF